MVAPLQHARERIDFIREPPQPDGLSPIKLLRRRPDMRYIVFDPTLRLGDMTASVWSDLESATAAAWALRRSRP